MEHLDFDVIIKNRDVVVSSLNVADIFKKQHKNVLRDIDNLKDDWRDLVKELSSKVSPVKNELNAKMSPSDETLTSKVRAVKFEDCFTETSYLTKDGRTVRSYDMNRTGFTLLANGFNGKKALRFKLAFISRFDEMERELIVRSTLYDLEKQLRKQLTDTLSEFYEGERLSRNITKYTNLLYISVVGNAAVKIKRDRGYDKNVSVFADILTSEERSHYIAKENELISLLKSGHDIYSEIKDILLKEKELVK